MTRSPRRIGLIAISLLAVVGVGAGILRLRDRSRRESSSRDGADGGGRAGGANGRGGGATPHGTPPATAGRGGSYHTGTTILSAKWGSGLAELGRKRDEESAPEAPMSAAIAPNGDILVLDQVNGRVQRYRADGTHAGSYPAGGDTNQDIAVTPDGRALVLDRLADKELSIFDADGKLLNTIPVPGGAIDNPGGVTGVFADGSGIYLEREHTELVRVAGPDGTADPDRPTEPGRPSRDGQYFVAALIVDAAGGIARVRVFNRDASVAWERVVGFPRSIVHLLLLDTDKHGHLYLGALVANERPEPPHDLIDQATVVMRMRLGDGTDAGSLTLPPNTSPDETFRELIVGDDGTLYHLLPGEDGYTVTSYTFP